MFGDNAPKERSASYALSVLISACAANSSSCSSVGFRVWLVEELVAALLVDFEGAIVNSFNFWVAFGWSALVVKGWFRVVWSVKSV